MYEVQPDDHGRWTLYWTGDDGCNLVARFSAKPDAELAREAFTRRADAGSRNRMPQPDTDRLHEAAILRPPS
jgi:hypothetical protein